MRSTSSWLLLAVAASAWGTGPVVGPPPRLTGDLGVRLRYDSNPFKYSDGDLGLFRLGAEPARFPFRSADDVDLNLTTSWRYRPGRDDRLRVRLTALLHQFVSNPENSYAVVRGGIDIGLRQGSTLSARGTCMPSYLIRNYRVPGDAPDLYLPCRFAEYLAGLDLRQRLGPVALAGGYRFGYDDYVQAFEVYDSRCHRLRAGADLSFGRPFAVSVDYEHRLAQARGPVPDISYRQHGVDVRAVSRPRGHPRLSFEAGYGIAVRAYSTANPPGVDPSHAGRVDQIEQFRLQVGYRLGAARLEASYEHEWRRTNSPNYELIEDIKQYRRSVFVLGTTIEPGRLL